MSFRRSFLYADVSQVKLKPRFSAVFILVLVLMESDGFVSGLLTSDENIAKWLYSGFMLLACIISFFDLIFLKKGRELGSFFIPVGVFVFIFAVSAVSNIFIFPKKIGDWAPSLYVFMPLFVFYVYYLSGATIHEVGLSIIVVAVLVAGVLIIDRFYLLPFLDRYQRFSSFNGLGFRRIVLLKELYVFGVILVISSVISSSLSGLKMIAVTILSLVLFFTMVLVMESRMGFLATGIATIALLKFRGLTKRVLVLLSLIVLFVFLILPVVFEKQIEKISQMSMDNDEDNISVRVETVKHMLNMYEQSHFWGVGMMSPSGGVNNILYSVEGYNVADGGAITSLTQFGVGGLLIWLFLTYRCGIECLLYYKRFGRKCYTSAGSAAFLVGFTVTIFPLSFFTQAPIIVVGGVLLYVLFLCHKDRVIAHKHNSRLLK